MKPKKGLLLVAVFLFVQVDMNGVILESPAAQASLQSDVSMGHYLSKIIVRTTDGKVFYGLLVGVEKNELIMKKGASETRVALENLAEVVLKKAKNPKPFMISGLIFSVYTWNILASRAKHQPTAYLAADYDSESWEIVWDAILAAAGIGSGYLASLFERGEEKFQFNRGDADRLARWEEFKNHLAGGSRPQRLHLSIQSGHVFTTVSHRYKKVFTDAGYYTGGGFYAMSPGSSPYEYGTYVQSATRFNFLRKAQLTVSLNGKVDVGATVVFSGEPGVGGYGTGDQVWQTYHATGYYAVAVYKPLSGPRAKTTRWDIGLGLGASRADFELGAYSQSDYPDYEEKWAQHQFAQTVPSGMVFTELSFFFGPNTSFGLIADYVFGPARTIPAFPEWGVSGQKIRLGNGCIGASFGMHF